MTGTDSTISRLPRHAVSASVLAKAGVRARRCGFPVNAAGEGMGNQ
jgi:hypothetical protein